MRRTAVLAEEIWTDREETITEYIAEETLLRPKKDLNLQIQRTHFTLDTNLGITM